MKAKRQSKKKNGRKTKLPFLNRKGQSLVEFAFILTIFVVLFCFLMGLVQISYNWVVLQYAASEASRFGSIGVLDPGFVSREANIRSRVTNITDGLGVHDVVIEFLDQAGGATAGGASEYFKMKLTHALPLPGVPAFLLGMGGFGEGTYEVTTWTVIRNEPF